MSKLERLREAAGKATLGPWQMREHRSLPPFVDAPAPGRAYGQELLADDYHDGLDRTADVAFVALCDPQTILALLDAVEALRRLGVAHEEVCPAKDTCRTLLFARERLAALDKEPSNEA